jgi:hypothetical protein
MTLQLLKPYTAMDVGCADCGAACQVIIWNGVGDWSMAPSFELMAMEETIIVTLKVSPESAEGMAAWIVGEGPHVADRIIAWAKDEATYALLVKLVTNPHLIPREEPDAKAHAALH